MTHFSKVYSSLYSTFSPSILELGEVAKRRLNRVAFVGTPCQIHGLRKAEAIMPRLRERIVIRLGLHCLGVFSTHFLDHILAKAGTTREQVSQFQFRSKEPWGWPCHMHIEQRSGLVTNLRGSYSRLAPRPAFIPYRCLLCFDKLCELADLSCGDCRVARQYGVRRLKELAPRKEPGLSDVVVRSGAAEDLLRAAVEANVLHLVSTTPRELLRTTKVAEKKLGVPAYSRVAVLFGMGRPAYDTGFRPRGRWPRLLQAVLCPFSLAAAVQQAIGYRLLGAGWFRALLRALPHALLMIIAAVRDRVTGHGALARAEVAVRAVPPPAKEQP
jgi:hypothetical protein